MRVEENVRLAERTTFGMGGLCRQLLIPETEEELLQAVRANPEARLLAGGSNVIISNEKEFPCVISLQHFNRALTALGDGRFLAGASLRNQPLIKKVNEAGYGGIEYLWTVPGTVGGAIFMNAGTGRDAGKSIGQHVERVRWFDGTEIRELSAAECGFAYRTSVFQEKRGVILSAVLRFPEQSREDSERLIRERKERVERLQDHSAKTCGTFCRASDPRVMKLLKIWPGPRHGVYFSRKTHNWLLNDGSGKFAQVRGCIARVRRLHRLLGKTVSLEVELWE